MLTNIAATLTYVLPLMTLWVAVLWMRPAVARARVQYAAEKIHDDLVDAILSRHIEPDNPRAIDALAYAKFVAEHPNELCLSAVASTGLAARNAGIDLVDLYAGKTESALAAAEDMADEQGKDAIAFAEGQLDRIVAWLLVRNTVVWPVFVLLQHAKHVFSYVKHTFRAKDERQAQDIEKQIDLSSAHEQATEIRESARGAKAPQPEFLSHFDPGARRHDLVPA